MPTENVTRSITTDELAGHVDFLAQRGLKGRSARSWESKKVRRYLSERLVQYGCEPWADCDSFEQSFRFGTNVIGVLPGSDPELSDEIILISAHYDHLKAKLFSYYPGAGDNAAAVAVLLEIAEKLSRSENRSKRPICFAFFDAEEDMCLGSFAFTCRDDYDEDRIAAVINVDLLGRNLLDVVDNSLIVSGTEHYASIEREVVTACEQNNLQLIPFEKNLIGPVGDHTAFTLAERPVLFFTCGINKDYHQTTDTPEKLDYDKLKRESAAVEQTLVMLANAGEELFERVPSPITHQKIESFVYILDQFKDHHETLKLDPNDIDVLDKLIAETNAIDPETITRTEMVKMQREALGDLLKLLKNYNPTLSQYSHAFLSMSELYAMRPKELTVAYKETINHYLTHHPSLLSKNDFSYQMNLPITERDWGIVQTGDDAFLFGAVNTEIALNNQIHVFKGIDFAFTFKNKLTACKGSLEEIIEYALLGKDPNGLENQSHEAFYMMGSVKSEAGSALSNVELAQRKREFWGDFKGVLEQNFPAETAADRFAQYDNPTIFVFDPNDCGCNVRGIFITSPDSRNARKASEEQSIAHAVKRLYDRTQHVEDRVNALNYLAYAKGEIALTAIANVLDEATPYAMKSRLIYDPEFPLYDHPYVQQYRTNKEKRYEKLKDKTLDEIAYEKLKELTKKDFGKDQDKWKRWIDRKY